MKNRYQTQTTIVTKTDKITGIIQTRVICKVQDTNDPQLRPVWKRETMYPHLITGERTQQGAHKECKKFNDEENELNKNAERYARQKEIQDYEKKLHRSRQYVKQFEEDIHKLENELHELRTRNNTE